MSFIKTVQQMQIETAPAVVAAAQKTSGSEGACTPTGQCLSQHTAGLPDLDLAPER